MAKKRSRGHPRTVWTFPEQREDFWSQFWLNYQFLFPEKYDAIRSNLITLLNRQLKLNFMRDSTKVARKLMIGALNITIWWQITMNLDYFGCDPVELNLKPGLTDPEITFVSILWLSRVEKSGPLIPDSFQNFDQSPSIIVWTFCWEKRERSMDHGGPAASDLVGWSDQGLSPKVYRGYHTRVYHPVIGWHTLKFNIWFWNELH